MHIVQARIFADILQYWWLGKLEILVNLFTRRGCVVSSHHINIHIDKNWQHIFLLSLYTLYFSSWVYCKTVLHNKCFIKLRSWIFVWALLYMYIVPLPLLSACTNMFCVNIRSRNQDHFNTRHLNHWSHPRSNGSKQCSCGEACRL